MLKKKYDITTITLKYWQVIIIVVAFAVAEQYKRLRGQADTLQLIDEAIETVQL